MQLSLIEVRDNRQKEWFWIDNEFVDRYSRIVGPVATLVYIALSRHADQGTQSCFPSMQTIGDEIGIKSRKTVAKGIKTLEQYGIIQVRENFGAGGVRHNNTYSLTNRRTWKDATKEPKIKREPVVPVVEPTRPLFVGDLPDWMDMVAWREWVAYRKESKKELKPSTIKLQVKFLEQHKAQHAEIIRKSIMNGWSGLFPLKDDDTKKKVEKVEAPAGKYAHLSK